MCEVCLVFCGCQAKGCCLVFADTVSYGTWGICYKWTIFLCELGTAYLTRQPSFATNHSPGTSNRIRHVSTLTQRLATLYSTRSVVQHGLSISPHEHGKPRWLTHGSSGGKQDVRLAHGSSGGAKYAQDALCEIVHVLSSFDAWSLALRG